jgi:thiol:disulfide interchange protein DsbD
LVSGLLAALPVRGQFGQDGGFGNPRNHGGAGDAAVTLSAQFTQPEGDNPGRLFIKATVKHGWEIYSITQAPHGPTRSVIKLKPSGQFRIGDFQAAPLPEKRADPLYKGLIVETHQRTVVWHAPVQLAPGVDPASLKIEGSVYVQACELPAAEGIAGACLPPRDFSFVAALGPGLSLDEANAGPPSPDTGGRAGIGSPGTGVATRANSGSPDASAPPDVSAPPLPGAPPSPSSSSQQPEGSNSMGPPPPGPGVVAGANAPAAGANTSEMPAAGQERLTWRPFTMASLKRVAPQFNWDEMKGNVAGVVEQTPLLPMILLAFLGGLILNVMPCVLPVIGLKILSFVEQAGHDRRRILVLNLWYALGMISVFMALAGLAIGLKLGWGQQFQQPGFNIVMAAIVFAMGLSFLGVWEIPIPGFVGRGKAAQVAQAEGFAGAFVKGVLTTILATPCTGPFMGSALPWALRQPPPTTLLVFAAVGLGMASPYLLLGAFPKLLRVLPKPGAWMETFKQVMGFVLLATVVYIFTFLDPSYVVPTVGLLFAIWAGCWWIGREGLALADTGTKFRAWLGASAFVGAVWILMFPGIGGITGHTSLPGLQEILADRLRSRAELQLAEQGLEAVPARDRPAKGPSTVLIDFTADWCPNCKLLEATVLNSDEIREAAARNGVVTMTADRTNPSKDVDKMLQGLGYNQIPVVAILPARDPNHPICFPSQERELTKAAILEGLAKAGPSLSDASSAQAPSGSVSQR